VVDDALGCVGGIQAAVPRRLREESDVWTEVALAKAGIPDQPRLSALPQELDQALAQVQPAALATVRTTTDHDHVRHLKPFSLPA